MILYRENGPKKFNKTEPTKKNKKNNLLINNNQNHSTQDLLDPRKKNPSQLQPLSSLTAQPANWISPRLKWISNINLADAQTINYDLWVASFFFHNFVWDMPKTIFSGLFHHLSLEYMLGTSWGGLKLINRAFTLNNESSLRSHTLLDGTEEERRQLMKAAFTVADMAATVFSMATYFLGFTISSIAFIGVSAIILAKTAYSWAKDLYQLNTFINSYNNFYDNQLRATEKLSFKNVVLSNSALDNKFKQHQAGTQIMNSEELANYWIVQRQAAKVRRATADTAVAVLFLGLGVLWLVNPLAAGIGMVVLATVYHVVRNNMTKQTAHAKTKAIDAVQSHNDNNVVNPIKLEKNKLGGLTHSTLFAKNQFKASPLSKSLVNDFTGKDHHALNPFMPTTLTMVF
ncbi:MAG: hypothetical protein Tsb005_21300 [Gammaproteobacteria bacterium]